MLRGGKGTSIMRVGVPKEIKDHEYRVGLVPMGVRALVAAGHEVLVQSGAGAEAGFDDASYAAAGATVVAGADDVFAAEMVVKVKEPLPAERRKLRPGQVLFTYLHLAPDAEQTDDLLASGAICIAYETITSPTGGLPLLQPMSEVAGRLAPQIGAQLLTREGGGRGILLGGVPGVLPGRCVILGAGTSGTNAADTAVGLGAEVVVLDRSLDALRRIEARFGRRVITAASTTQMVAEQLRTADLAIGAVLVPGAAAPRVLTREMIAAMPTGSVFVDIAIDQGGCSETSRPTTHSAPTYVVDGVIHYCVTNMPGAVPRTSTLALTNATLPHVLTLAAKGWKQALAEDPHLRNGLNLAEGKLVLAEVAQAQGKVAWPVGALLGL